jgi:hypothetical protein
MHGQQNIKKLPSIVPRMVYASSRVWTSRKDGSKHVGHLPIFALPFTEYCKEIFPVS